MPEANNRGPGNKEAEPGWETWSQAYSLWAVSSCPYVVDLTGPLEAVETPAATRNEDLFPTDCDRGRKRAAPAGSGNDSPRDRRLRRTTER